MTKHEYSVEEIRLMAGVYQSGKVFDMLNAYATLLEQIERAREGVTREVVQIALQAFAASLIKQREAGGSAHHKDMRAAIQSVAHLLPSSDRDAYEGAREDLHDWKGRAQRAEERLRALGYTGIDASEDPAHPPAHAAQAAQVDDKVVVIRDGKTTTEGLVLAAAIYMGAVKDIFALRPDGQPYNERRVTKDTGALRAFDHLDAATKALRSAISHFSTPTADPVTQGEAIACPECGTLCAHRAIPVSDDVVHEYTPVAAQPRPVPDGWVLVPREPTTAMLDSAQRSNEGKQLPRFSVLRKRWTHMLAAAPSPGDPS